MIETLAKWIFAAVLFTLVCLGLAEKGEGQNLAGRGGRDFNTQREITILTPPPQMYWDEQGELHNPGMLNPYPQRSTVVIEDGYDANGSYGYRLADPVWLGVPGVPQLDGDLLGR